MIRNLVAISFLFWLCTFNSFGQYSKGMIRMEVAGMKMNGEDAPPEMASMLGNMQVIVYSNGIIQKNVMSMMMMKNSTILDSKKDSVFLYMDMMGKKYLIADQMNKANKDAIKDSPEQAISVKEFPEDTKEILGHVCKRVDLKMMVPSMGPEGGSNSANEITIKTYVTKDLNFDPSFISQNNRTIKLDGTPLEFSMLMGTGSFQLELQMVAKELKAEINPDDLLPPSGNFKRYTMEEFQKEVSKMGR